MAESMIREIIKEALVEQEASLKAVISEHVEELKKLIFNVEPKAGGGSTAVGDVNEPAEEDDDATWKEIPKFGGELGMEEWIHICECYFEEKGISSDDEKVQTASLHMNGSLTWNEYADLLLAHYGQKVITSVPADSSPPSWKYDIFISFRGGDTRRGFASHLFHALKNADINCFRDVDGDERGRVVWPMLSDAIHQSMIVLVLFSENYADSKWCLKELVEILRFNKQHCADGHKVLPIFYDVGPYEVRHQTGAVEKAFKRCKAETKLQKKQWRDALKEAGEISSWTLANTNREEAEFIEEIVEDLRDKVLYSRSAYFVKNPVGMKDNVDHLISLLETPSTTGIRTVGIYGAQGIGKTTLAKMICRQLYKVFNGRVSLLQNIHSVNNNNEGIIGFQRKLIQDVIKIKRPLLSEDKGKNVSDIRKRLYNKKVLLVLDGVENSHEMLSIIGTGPEKFLHSGSVILITTRNKQLLYDLKVDKIDMIPPLDPKNSLQLFYQHALIDETADSGVGAEYDDTCTKLVHYARGLPQAIRTLGTFLVNRPKDEWDRILGKLVRSSSLGSIGIYSDSISDVYGYRKFGPYGGVGTPFDHGRFTTVRKVKVFMAGISENHNDQTVHAMIVDYDYNGSFISAGQRPGLEETRPYYSLALDYPDEYLTSVSGYIAENYQCRAIRSIKFYGNKNRQFAYGQEIGTPFSFPDIDSGCIVGFSGNRDHSFLNSIAAHFGPPNPSPYTTAGPFGGGGVGKYWDDGKHLDIRRIEVFVGDSGVINSIRTTYDNYGHPLGPFIHGDETGAGVAHLVEVDYPYEYLTAISGHVTNVVCSLTFHSNTRKHGPFGDEIGQRFFTAQSTGVKIVGFFGWNDIGSSGGLESIGVHLEAVSHIHPKRVVGPFGGEIGEIWDHKDSCDKDIRKMLISWGSDGVTSISRVDDDTDNNSQSYFATSTSSKLIQLNYPTEYIKAMEGWFNVEPNGDAVLKELTFESNIATYGPYGDKKDITYGTYFRTPCNIGKITGFYGRRSGDRRLSSIGAYFEPVYHLHPLKTIGPFGDYFSGSQWDDGSHSGIRQIKLRSGTVIDSITLVYDDGNGNGGSLHGETDENIGGSPTEIVLDYPNEYLVAMTGYMGTFGGCLCVRSLTFETNKRKKLGPYGGTVEGKYFSIRSNIGKIVGFYGSSDIYLYSIGAHIQLL